MQISESSTMPKNRLGHDDESELLTVIARMRQNKFRVLRHESNTIHFEIGIRHTQLIANVSFDSETRVSYIIERYEFNYGWAYTFRQIGGKESRLIPLSDGYIIWELAKGKL